MMNLSTRGLSIEARPGQFAALLLKNLCDGCRLHALLFDEPQLLEAVIRAESRCQRDWAGDATGYLEHVIHNLADLVAFLKTRPRFSEPGSLAALELATEFLSGRLILNPTIETAGNR